MVNVTRSGECFECGGCGNIIEVKKMGGGELLCCGQPMRVTNLQNLTQMNPNTTIVQH